MTPKGVAPYSDCSWSWPIAYFAWGVTWFWNLASFAAPSVTKREIWRQRQVPRPN